MNKKKEIKNPDIDITELEMNTCSAQDCTGLVPSAPTNAEAIEDYEDIYPQLNDSGF